MGLSQIPGRGAGLQAPSPEVATAGAPPSWMSSPLKSNGDDDDDTFAQPVPVSKSATVAKDEGVPSTGGSEPVASTSMPPWAKPYKPKTQEPSPDSSRVKSTPSLGSGMPKWGQKTIPPAPKQAESGILHTRTRPPRSTSSDVHSRSPAATTKTNKTSAESDAKDEPAGGLDWLQSLAPPTATTGAAPSPSHEQPRRPSGDTSGEEKEKDIDWLGAALKGDPSVAKSAVETFSGQKEGQQDDDAGGDDWLAIAKSSGQAKQKPLHNPTARRSVAVPAPGGWMSSGQLGLSTEDGSDEDVAAKASGGGGSGSSGGNPILTKKKKKQKQLSVSASGPGGWLSSGALGVTVEDESDDDDDDDVGGPGGGDAGESGRGVAVTIETQTEEDIESITKRGATETANVPKLPPWAKPYVPPPKPDIEPAVAPGKASTSGEEVEKEGSEMPDWLAAAAGIHSGQETLKVLSEEPGQVAAGPGDEDGGDGLSWLTQAAGSSVSGTASPAAPSSAPVDSGKDGLETGGGLDDWLNVAKHSGQTKRKSVVTVAAPAATGGWMTSGKLGISTQDDSDQDDAGKTGGSVSAVTKPKKKKKKAAQSPADTSGPGGWMGSGALWAPAEDESGDEDSGSSETDRGVGVTIETQTEEDIEAVAKSGATEKGNAPKLPPWAKPYVPPPKPEVVPDIPPEANSAPQGAPEKQEPFGAMIEEAQPTAGQEDSAGGGGLSWLTQAAGSSTSGAAAPIDKPSAAVVDGAVGGVNDWLAVAKSSGQTKRKPHATATAAAKAAAVPAAPGGWLSSGKLGVSTEEENDQDDAGKTAGRSTTPKKKKKQAIGAVPVASSPEGWLSSVALGVPEEESDDDDNGGGDGQPILVTMETQTEDDIEGVTERGNVPKLPPWAKPYVPPPKDDVVPESTADSTAEKTPEKEETDASAAPDWILAALGDQDADGFRGGVPASGGGSKNWLSHAAEQEPGAGASDMPNTGDTNAPDWLQQAAAPSAKPKDRQAASIPQQRSGIARKAAVPASPLSWMKQVKRRSSMDLDDPTVETTVAQAKAKAAPGGWLQIGALGAPDALAEENELEQARAASPRTR
ncbi:unnamed protein product [Ectocarpus sp. CCAP 1310/34]|nr:unnamed protein product [Ectocarpus sp. CCAP 1310/34]